jgi:transcriptional regulator with XRE-family HTH domain
VDAAPLIGGYRDLVEALIARRHALGVSQLELEELAGLSSGFVSHLESWNRPHGRRAGDVTLTLWLGALGLGLRLVEVRPGRGTLRAEVHCGRDRREPRQEDAASVRVAERVLAPEPVQLRPRLRNMRQSIARRPQRVPA